MGYFVLPLIRVRILFCGLSRTYTMAGSWRKRSLRALSGGARAACRNHVAEFAL